MLEQLKRFIWKNPSDYFMYGGILIGAAIVNILTFVPQLMLDTKGKLMAIILLMIVGFIFYFIGRKKERIILFNYEKFCEMKALIDKALAKIENDKKEKNHIHKK
jgi:hypothetical protein